MALTVLSVASPLARVAPDAVGGAEQVLAMIDDELVSSGHRSIVIACAGSRCRGELIALPHAEEDRVDRTIRVAQHEACRAAIREALRREHVDVVHVHGLDFETYAADIDVPVLATLHLPVSWYRPSTFTPRARWLFAFVSATQRASATAFEGRAVVVPNGVRLEQLRTTPHRGDDVVGLGRICSEKGFHLALDACREADVPMRLAGKVFGYPEHMAYFRDEIEPRLDDRRWFIGSVDVEARRDLLARARCLIAPSLTPETSSLVAMEALASGTPVVAMRRGALPEIVEDGVTGIIVDRAEDLAPALRDIGRIDRQACRAAAERRFDAKAMCARYIDLLEELSRSDQPRSSPAPTQQGVEIVRSCARMRALAPEWHRLWARSDAATPFSHPAWVLAAAEVFAPQELSCIAAWRGAALAGVAPLGVTAGELHFLGRTLSDYLDAVIAPDHVTDVGRQLAAAIERIDGWDRAALTDLPATSVFCSRSFMPPDAQPVQHEVCPVLDLIAEGAIPTEKLRELERCERRSVRRGVRVRAVTDARSAHDTFDELVRLHELRWNARGEPGVLGDPQLHRFHHVALAGLQQSGVARLYRLEQRDRCIGVLYGLIAHGRLHFYTSGFDPEAKDLSPGLLMVGRAITDAKTSSLRAFDFLRGEERYKYAWGARPNATYRVVFERTDRHQSDEVAIAASTAMYGT